jgi:hypothetical protein
MPTTPTTNRTPVRSPTRNRIMKSPRHMHAGTGIVQRACSSSSHLITGAPIVGYLVMLRREE